MANRRAHDTILDALIDRRAYRARMAALLARNEESKRAGAPTDPVASEVERPLATR
jgi:hypothetical protein